MSESIEEKIKNKISGVNPKAYSRVIQSDIALFNELKEVTKSYSPSSIAEMIYIAVNGPPPVTQCGKKLLFNTFVKGYRTACGSKTQCACAKEAQREKIAQWQQTVTTLQREEMVNKSKTTFLDRYGVDNPMKNKEVKLRAEQKYFDKTGYTSPLTNPAVISKIKKINQLKYGVDAPLESTAIQQKSKDTTIKKYGSLMTHARAAFLTANDGKTPFQVDEVKTKIKQSLQERYNVDSPKHFYLTEHQISVLTNKTEFINFVSRKTFTQASIDLGVADTTIGNRARMFNARHLIAPPNRSRHERKISDLLTELGVVFIQNERTLCHPLQIDFYLPDYKIAIEVGSLFWHSESNAGREQDYHYSKWKRCKDAGVDLYQWFDDELDCKWDIIQDKIKYLTKANPVKVVGARKCKIIKTTRQIEREFLTKNHIQGDAWDRDLSWGAYFNNEIIGIITIKRRKNGMEITRFCTAIGISVPGLFSKMLKTAICETSFSGKVFSFSNNCHSNGNLYKALGFTVSSEVKATYWYTKNYHSQNFTRSKIAKKFGIPIDGKSELELMRSVGYDRIWDAGKTRWEITV